MTYNFLCSTTNEGQFLKHSIIWTIPKFHNYIDKTTIREVRSENVEGAQEINDKFLFRVQLFGSNHDLIEVHYLSPRSEFLKVSLVLCLVRFEERTVVTKEYHVTQANKWHHLASLFKREIIENNDCLLLGDGGLRLKFIFHVSCGIKVENTIVPEAQLNTDLQNLLNNGLFSDITMRSIEGIEYKVHKAVVASRSEVLKAHFEHNTTECITNLVESSLESDILQEVLTFIYSDKAPRVDEFPERLLAAADYYQLKRLKSICEESLHKRLTVDNAVDTLQLADVHAAATLKQLTLEFIKDGQAKLITKSDGWTHTKSVELIKSIYEYIMDDNLDHDMK